QKAAQARRDLDTAIDAFEKQLATSAAAGKDSPQLVNYFTAAKKYQDTSRDLIEQLLRRQLDQYARLNELNTRMDEKLAARRADAQTAIASDIDKRLSTIADARKTGVDVGEIAVASADEEMRRLETTAAALADRISARKRQLQADRNGNYAMLDASERQRLLEV